MIGFKLNSAGDIEASDGKITLLSTIQEAVRQRLQIKLRTFQNEWFLDTTYGIPYRQQIIGKGLSKAEIDALYISEINSDPDVQRIVYFNSTYNPYSRLYDLDFEVRVLDELLRVDTASITASEEIDYPVPDNSALLPSCDAPNALTYVCDIHKIVHCDLSECGSSTWITGSEPYVDLDYVLDGYVSYTVDCDGECFSYVESDYMTTGYTEFTCSEYNITIE